jgi:hypothetical protein
LRPDRRRHHRRTRICEQQFREKEMSTSASSRSAAQPAGAGRSASELAGIDAASRVRVGTASMSNSSSLLQIFRSVVDDPVARAAPAPADIIIIDRPDPPTSIVAPNQNLRTTIH